MRQIRTGHVLHTISTGTSARSEAAQVGVGPATAIALKNDGAIAWIVETGYPTEYQVRTLEGSEGRLLASGTNIDPSSLALAGSTLYWMQGGKPTSASLK
jgi:hypothetical protein